MAMPENLSIVVSVDGSGSMAGYANAMNSRYQASISALSVSLQNQVVPHDSLEYWRIGVDEAGQNASQRLSDSQFLAAQQSSFYDCSSDQFPCVTSPLIQFLEVGAVPEDQAALRVLITDLEPDGLALGRLSGQISRQLSENPGYEAALVGIRSEFEGRVFPNVPGSFEPFPYSTANQPVDEAGRPFFMLLLGPSQAVRQLIDGFSSLETATADTFRVSKFGLGTTTTTTLNPTFSSADAVCTRQVYSLNRGWFNRISPAADQVDQWLLLRSCARDTGATLTFESEPIPGLAVGELPTSGFAAAEGGSAPLSITEVTSDGERIRLQARLMATGVHTQRLDLRPEVMDLLQWQDWNLQGTGQSGNQIQNLSLFVGGLRQAVTATGEAAPAARFCIAYQR